MMDRMAPALDKYVEQYRDDPEYVLEGLYLAITEQICRHMRQTGTSQADLARRMQVSEAWVSKMLTNSRNLTLRSLAKALVALDADMEAYVVPRPSGRAEPWAPRREPPVFPSEGTDYSEAFPCGEGLPNEDEGEARLLAA